MRPMWANLLEPYGLTYGQRKGKGIRQKEKEKERKKKKGKVIRTLPYLGPAGHMGLRPNVRVTYLIDFGIDRFFLRRRQHMDWNPDQLRSIATTTENAMRDAPNLITRDARGRFPRASRGVTSLVFITRDAPSSCVSGNVFSI